MTTLVSVLLVGLGSAGCSGGYSGDEASQEEFGSVGSALNISSNSTGTVGNWFYTFWKDGGSTSMNLNSDGSFSVSWQAGSSYNYVGGPGWRYGDLNRRIGYNCGSWTGSNVNSYLTIYGWSVNPLIEYYILQNWGTYDPTGGATQGVTFTSNGVTYTAYRTQRVQKPSILGTQTFYQYWSKPSQKQAVGSNRTIHFADHAAAWAQSFGALGQLNQNGSGSDSTYQVLAVEVFGPSASGSASCTVWDATATCNNNGVQDNGETGVDCGGGSCGACATPTCSDGVMNGTETGVDCGGSCAACGGSGSGSDAIFLEAEQGTLSGSPAFSSGSDANASNGSFLAPTQNSTGSAGSNRVSFTFNANAGTYKVWGRVITPTVDDDSFWVSMDGGAFTNWNSIAASSSWQWDDVHDSNASNAVKTYTLSAGTHTLTIANREDGTKLDKIYITKLGDTPSGMGGSGGGSCTPDTCLDLGVECGSISDGCGGMLSCGSCPTDYSCNANLCSCAAVAAPTGVTASSGDGQASVSWSAVAGTLGYTVKRSTTNGSGYTEVATVTTTSYTDTGLTNGTTYYYVVVANSSCASSGNSSQKSVTPNVACIPTTCAAVGATCGSVSDGCGGTLSCGSCGSGYACNATNTCECGTVATPTGVTATAGNGQAALSWSAVSGATSYEVKRSTTSGSGHTTVATVTGTSYTNTGLTNGTTYYYVIVANSSCASSGNSSQASAQPAAPSGLGCTTANSTARPRESEADLVAGQCYSFNKTMGSLQLGSWSNPNFTVNIQDSTGAQFSKTLNANNWFTVSGVANGTGFFKLTANGRMKWSDW